MKYFYTFIIACTCIIPCIASAAQLKIEQKTEAVSGLVQIDIVLDAQGESINALSGVLSLPSNYFSIDAVSTAGSVVSLWLVQPHVSTDRLFDTRIRIPFEGAMPGGFTGIRSPYYEGERPGVIFSVTLRPETAGEALLLLENVDIRLNDGKATKAQVQSETLTISIPNLATIAKIPKTKSVSQELAQSEIKAFLSQSDSIQNGKWVLMIHDDTQDRTPQTYSVAESRSSFANDIHAYEWKKVSFPYVLAHQSRDRFIHIKSDYADGAYSFTTLSPVENSNDIQDIWRILILLALALILGYVLKQKHHTTK